MNIHALFSLVAAGVALTIGIFAVALDRRAAIWRLFLAGMALLAAERLFAALGSLALLPERALAWQRARLMTTAFLPALWLLFSLVHARGRRRDRLRRWWPVLLLFAMVPVTAVLGQQLLATEALDLPPGEGGQWAVRLGPLGKALQAAILLASVLVLMNLERTLRGSVGTMRWRIKFMILGTGTIFAVRIHTATQALLYATVYANTDILNASALLLGGALMAKGLPRAREDRLDLYVSHTVLYRSLAVLLCAVYLLVVGALAGVIRQARLAMDLPLLSLLIFCGIVGLSVLWSSDRFRLRTKRLVSRHFRRPQYDCRQIWMRFADATAGMMARDACCRAVARMVSETFEALSVTIWLPGVSRDRMLLGASTAIPSGTATAGAPADTERSSSWIRDACQAMHEGGCPVDIDVATDAWAVALRDMTPSSFPGKGGCRLAVPLIARDTLTGIMVVGDRVGGIPFTPEELDLLGVIAGQAGAGLLNADLSDRLLQSRELEAFQTMSAFFVHDLKNTASTLSLMLENLPRHFADPAFREDALKAVGKCVGRLDTMIGRLTALRHKLDIHPRMDDLNGLVRKTVERLAEALDPAPAVDLTPLPPVSFDSEQIDKVLTNLVLNASEAMNRKGRVCIGTRYEHGTATLSVSDEGAGMSRRYVEESLFRPFRSTKKDGLGIGLFQSRMIVEAHGGRIEVESEEGRGSTFRVRLPVEGNR